MPTLYITVGVPGSGKSTWAKGFSTIDPDSKKLMVNRDDIRSMLLNDHQDFDYEAVVTSVQHRATLTALNRGYDVINHDTNLNVEYLTDYMGFIVDNYSNEKQLIIVLLEFLLDAASTKRVIEMDSKRERPVGEERILEFVSAQEAFDWQAIQYFSDDIIPFYSNVVVNEVLSQIEDTYISK